METLGNRLKQQREKVNLNQKECADLGGVSPKSQGYYEKDMRSPDADYLQKISSKIDIAFVVTGLKSLREDKVQQEIDAHLVKQLGNTQLMAKLAREFDLRKLNDHQVDFLCKLVAGAPTTYEQLELMMAAFLIEKYK